ncbi:hypothetical protein LTR15_009771 [Elasticomyces elasticus]|nr:hypothetical protein LTR15_009771 [Elasticomyces elasticus]
MEEAEICNSVSFEPQSGSPTGSEQDVHLDFSIDIVEDVAAEVEAVMRLSVFGLFREARKAADETMKRYLGYFPVAVEYLRLLYDQGDFDMLRQEAERFREGDYRLEDAVPEDLDLLLLLCDLRNLGGEVPLLEDLESMKKQTDRICNDSSFGDVGAGTLDRLHSRTEVLMRLERLCAARTGLLAEPSEEPWPLLSAMVRDFVAKEQYWIAEKALELCFWSYGFGKSILPTNDIWNLIELIIDTPFGYDEDHVLGRIGVLLSFCEGALRRSDTQSDSWTLASSYLVKASSHMASLYPGLASDWDRSRAVVRLTLLELDRSLAEEVSLAVIKPTISHILNLRLLNFESKEKLDMQLSRGIEGRIRALGYPPLYAVEAHLPEPFPSCIYRRHHELRRSNAQAQAQQAAILVRSSRNTDRPQKPSAPSTHSGGDETDRAYVKRTEQASKDRVDQDSSGDNRKQSGEDPGYGRPWQPWHTRATHGEFQWAKDLGRGPYGVVTVVRQLSSDKSYVQKFVAGPASNARGNQQEDFEDAIQETFETMRKLSHKHITQMLFFVHTYEPDGINLFMLPVADSSLQHFLERSDLKNDELKALNQWFGCLASALSYAHKRNVKHANIKPANILIKDNRVYLADFGDTLATYTLEWNYTPAQMATGSSVYWAPEHGSKIGHSLPADVFALGCVFSEMLTVRQGRTLEEYREARRKPTGHDFHAFRAHVPVIETFLNGLPDVSVKKGEESNLSLILAVVLNMLREDPGKRLLLLWFDDFSDIDPMMWEEPETFGHVDTWAEQELHGNLLDEQDEASAAMSAMEQIPANPPDLQWSRA